MAPAIPKVTRLVESELDELARLVNSAYRGDESRLGWTTEADFLGGQRTDAGTLSSLLSSAPDRVILVLRESPGAPILGCVFVERSRDEKGIVCYLGMLAVSPRAQNRGVGKTLLTEAENFARAWGAARMTMNVIQIRESLIAWYERHGYRRTGKTKPFPYGDPKAGIPLRDDLRFLVLEREL